MELEEHWRIVADLIGRALTIERKRLGEEQAVVVRDYLDANELGLAHDHIVDALADADLEPSTGTAEFLAQAARRMDHVR